MVIFKHTSIMSGGVDEWAGMVTAERPWTLGSNCDLSTGLLPDLSFHASQEAMKNKIGV